jgi:uncharacterized membrane protein
MDDRYSQTARLIFGICLLAMGILGLISGDFAMQWQPVPAWVFARTALAYVCGALQIVLGLGLLFPRTAGATSRVLLVYVALWWLLLKVPVVVAAPNVEASWLGLGEISVILAGAWMLYLLFGRPGGPDTVNLRRAAMLFGLALIPIGLSHIFYLPQTAAFVPAWLPFRSGWAYFTGAAQIAAGLGVLFWVLPSLAATLEAVALTIFTILVWVPGLFAAHAGRLQWTAVIMSAMITAGAWAAAAGVAFRYRAQRPAVVD